MPQRKGRAGRTKPGYCYKLYTPSQEENSIDFPLPEIKEVDLKNVCLSLMKIGSDISKTNFSVEQTIEMFMEFIEPPQESNITDGFDFALKSGLIEKIEEKFVLSQIGNLVIDSRLDVMDGMALLYAWNISSVIFKRVFKIICICSQIKSGPEDFFFEDINPETKTNILNRFKKHSANSDHILLYLIYRYIESVPNESIFNLELAKEIERIYENQIDKLTRLYDKYNIVLEVKKKDSDTNIICSFNYGYKSVRAFRRGSEFKFNGLTCNLDKSIFDFKSYSSLIFYTNVLVNGKFNIGICSPYLLDKD